MTDVAAEHPAVHDEVRRVLWVTLALNLGVAFGKIAVGAFTGALAVSADGVHSLMDGSSNVVALWANRIAVRPPDAEHPYGHRRFETLAALGIGVLLFVTAWEIVRGAADSLLHGTHIDTHPVMFIVLSATLAVNLFVSRWERRAAERLRSQLLRADAANTGADVFVTLSVLVSTGAVAAFGWTWLDPLAALIVVVLIGRAGWQVLRQTADVLVDTAPYTPAALSTLAAAVPAVERVVRARSRGTPDAAHVDIDIEVAPATTAERADAIAAEIRRRVTAAFEGVLEVEVHVAPAAGAAGLSAITGETRALLQRHYPQVGWHDVRAAYAREGVALSLHATLPPDMPFVETHAIADDAEGLLRRVLPEVAQVTIHTEPTGID